MVKAHTNKGTCNILKTISLARLADLPKKQGGPGRGQGRKPLKSGEDTVPVTIRMAISQKEKLIRLGSAPWVRKKIDEAKVLGTTRAV